MGLSELPIVLVFGILWVVPIVAGVWALVTLQRIRSMQEEMSRRIEMLVRQLQRGAAQQVASITRGAAR